MAIDASIPLQVRTPQIDFADAYSKAQQIQGMKQEGQLRGLQIQSLEEQQRQTELMRSAVMDSNPDDPEDLVRRLTKYGADPQIIANLRKSHLDYKNSLLDRNIKENELQAAKNDQLRGMLVPIKDEVEAQLKGKKPDYTKASEMFSRVYQDAIAQGLTTKDDADKALQQLMPQGFSPEGFKFIYNRLATASQLHKEAMDEQNTAIKYQNAQTAARRAEVYAASIDNLQNYREDQMQLAHDQLKAKIDRDQTLDENEKESLRLRLDIAQKQIDAAMERAKFNADAAMERTKYTQEQISQRTDRVQKAITDRQTAKGVSGPKALAITKAALEVAKALPGWGNLSEEDQIATINRLIDAGVGNVQPVLESKPGEARGVLQNIGVTNPQPGTTVRPGAPIAPPANTPPASPQTAPQPSPEPGERRVFVTGPDGTGRKSIPESQLDAYLKAYPRAKKL